MNAIPNTRSRMDIIPNGQIQSKHLRGYRSVVQACLVRSFYKDAFNEKMIFYEM